MTQLTPISRERHATKRWRRFTSYDFASRLTVVPLVMAEMARAAQDLPIALLRQGSGYLPVAMLGLLPGVNLFVGPDGRWLGGYVPAFLRAYPFRLARAETEKLVFCMEEDSGLITDGAEGEVLFDADGRLSPTLREVFNFLAQNEANRPTTAAACNALDRHGLVYPLALTCTTEQGDRRIEGLFCVNGAALDRLSDEAFLDLRRAGALPLAYYQLQSMRLLGVLGNFAKARMAVPVQSETAQSSAVLADGESFIWH